MMETHGMTVLKTGGPRRRKTRSSALGSCFAILCALIVSVPAGSATAQEATVPETAAPASTIAPVTAPVDPVVHAAQMAALAGELSPLLQALPGVRAVNHSNDEPDVLKIISFREYQLYLPRVEERISLSQLERAAALELIVAQTAEGMEASNPFAIPALRVVVRPTAAVDSFEQQTGVNGIPNTVVRRPFAEGLDEVLVATTGTSIAFVPTAQLVRLQLGVTDAFTWGRNNTETMAMAVRFEEEDGLRIAILDGNFETSLLTVDRLWTQLAADMGGSLAIAAPSRSRLLIARTSDARAMARLRRIASTEGTGELALFDGVLLRQGRSWVAQ
jgi:hypothetical protein